MERAITTQNLVYSRETELSGASRMVDAMIALDENHLPSDALTWVAFEHFVTWEKGQADLLDLDRFVSQHCAPVFEACYPIWEAVQRHTRLHYGDVI